MSRRRVALLLILCADSGALLGPDGVNAEENHLVSLGTIDVGTPRGLNNNGQVLVSTGLFYNGAFTLFPSGFTGGAINEQGDVAGTNTAGHLALYKGGTVADLGGQPVGFVNGINASDQIVGATSNLVGFIYSAGVMTAIDGPAVSGATGSSIAEGINDTGEVTGAAYTHNGQNEAYLLANGVLSDLGPGGGDAINASGEVTGVAYRAGDSNPHAFIYGSGGMKVLSEPPPYIGSEGFAINRSGEIVGILHGGASSFAPFFFNGVMTDINLLITASDPLKPTVTIDSDIAINDNRLMFLSGHDSNLGGQQLYLLQAPWLDVAPGPLTFANQQVGTTSAAQLVTLTNSGTVALPLDSISISSASSAPEFQQTNACPNSLTPQAACTVSVTFAPTVAGDGTSKLDVVTNGATIEIPISGTSPIVITLSADPTQPMPGKPFTISWNATTGSSCQSSGGAPGDGWTAKTPSGSVSVTEATAATYVYQLACSAGSQNQVAKLSVTVGSPPAGGGGAVDVWALLTLCGSLGLRRGCPLCNASSWGVGR